VPIFSGNTLILTRATGSTPHLWVVLCDPVGDPAEVVIVSLTTFRAHSDDTVVLQPGDHPFVQHPTCVYYSDARITTVARLEIAIRQRQAIPREEMDAAIVERIRAGLYRSPFTVLALRERCRAFFEPPSTAEGG
jgi:hypothetical protein